MADTQDYTVNISNVSHNVRLGPNGSQTFEVVQYYVGTRGPFTLSYPKKDATQSAIQADIARQVSKLRSLDSGSY